MIPYTYLIGWTSLNLYYYGVRYSAKCKPEDLFTTYYTSSKRVIKIFKEYGQPDIIEIRKIFKDKESAILWEAKVLQKLKVQTKSYWINRNVAGAFKNKPEDYIKIGKKISKTRRLRKFTAWNKGLTKYTHPSLMKTSLKTKGIKVNSEEARKKMRKPKSSTINMKKPKSEAHKEKVSQGLREYFKDPNNRRKQSESTKNRKKLTCQYCNREISSSNINRHINSCIKSQP